MSEPFIGEIKIFAGNFAPRGWSFCNGQLLPISENEALFSLLGTAYGGDGRTTFGLPNLQGRVPIGPGQGPGLSNKRWADSGGSTTVALSTQQIPSHTHTLPVRTTNADDRRPTGRNLAPGTNQTYGALDGTTLHANAVQQTGGSEPHNNLQPYLVINYIIALTGVYPSRS